MIVDGLVYRTQNVDGQVATASIERGHAGSRRPTVGGFAGTISKLISESGKRKCERRSEPGRAIGADFRQPIAIDDLKVSRKDQDPCLLFSLPSLLLLHFI